MTSLVRFLWICFAFLTPALTLEKGCQSVEEDCAGAGKTMNKVKTSAEHGCISGGPRCRNTDDVKGNNNNNNPTYVNESNSTGVKCAVINDSADNEKIAVYKTKHIYNAKDILRFGLQKSLLFMCTEDEYILYTYVCNCHIDCSNGRDEEFCSTDKQDECGHNLTDCSTACPRGFQCVGDAVAANDFKIILTSLDIFPITTKFLNLTGLNLTTVVKPLALPNLLEVHACSSALRDLKTIFSKNISTELYHLDLSANNFKILCEFKENFKFKNLQFLNLSFNLELTEINYFCIASERLKSLDFSNTEKISVLQYLNVEGTLLQTAEAMKQLRHLKVTDSFLTDNPLLCCPHLIGPGIPENVCHAPKDSISSCDDLLVDTSKTFLLWLLAVLSFASNFIVLLYRICFDSVNYMKNYGILITTLSAADLLMAVYLLIISSVDVHYRHSYALYDEVWRSGHLCSLAGYLATFSFLVSNTTVFWITLDRYLMVRYSLGGTYFKTKILVVIIAITWFLGFILALIPHLQIESLVHSSNSLCLSLPFTTKHLPAGGPYSVTIFLVLHSVLFVCILSGQLAIFIASTCNLARSSNLYRSARRRRDDARIRRQLVFVATTHFISWASIFIFSMLSLFGDYEVSPNVYAWLVIAFTPLNAYCNPIIYSGAAICRVLRGTCKNRNSFRGNRQRVHLRRPSGRNEIEGNEGIELQEL